MNQSKHTPLSVDDALERLKVSRPTFYHLVATGQLQTYKIGRRRFTTTEFLDALIDRSAAKAGGRSL
jgi:excisionase family DNA binding protein